ncbi:hypothetical protein D3C78_1786920 [compost metagenome]
MGDGIDIHIQPPHLDQNQKTEVVGKRGVIALIVQLMDKAQVVADPFLRQFAQRMHLQAMITGIILPQVAAFYHRYGDEICIPCQLLRFPNP